MNTLLSTLAVLLGLYSILSLIVLVLRQKNIIDDSLPNLLLFRNQKQVVIGMTIVALVAFLGSNYYSEIVGYNPCKLCWYQRIVFFPQLFLLGLALWKRQWNVIAPYIALLSLIGLAIAGYHYYGQYIDSAVLPCEANGNAVCAFIPFGTFGFVTIPLMAFFGFLGQIALYIQWKTLGKKSAQ